MATDISQARPKAPFVIVTRKGGFPASTAEEAMRLVRPLVGDDKASVTDADGRKFAPRQFLDACERIIPSKPASSTDIKDWAAATADIDLDGGAPPGWSPPEKIEGAPSGSAVLPAGRSSGRTRAPASSRSSSSNPAARARSTSDRRPSSERRRRGEDQDGKAGIPPLVIILIIAGIVLAGVVIAVLGNRSAQAAAQTRTELSPRSAPAAPAPAPVNADGSVRPENRPLPTYMRD